MKKYAWVTLLSTIDYLEAVLVLNNSLKKTKTKYKLIAAITPNVSKEKEIIKILNNEGIIIELIPWLEYNENTKKRLAEFKSCSVFNVGSKIEIFGLTNYDKLVYIDADSLVIKNIDFLFTKKDGSSLVNDFSKCFCALFVFIPKNHPLEYYKTILNYCVANDGELLEKIWWQTIDNKKYHISNNYFYIPFDGNDCKTNIKAYHLLKKELKYWQLKKIPDEKLANKYKEYLFPIREKYKKELNKLFILRSN